MLDGDLALSGRVHFVCFKPNEALLNTSTAVFDSGPQTEQVANEADEVRFYILLRYHIQYTKNEWPV
jgi:hypothetical protein